VRPCLDVAGLDPPNGHHHDPPFDAGTTPALICGKSSPARARPQAHHASASATSPWRWARSPSLCARRITRAFGTGRSCFSPSADRICSYTSLRG
jgi:hypothetical protein